MSSIGTPISEKEVRELYEGLNKEQLVNILVMHWKAKKEVNESIPWKKNIPVNLIGF